MDEPVKTGGRRRQARELAVQFLYQYDVSGGTDLRAAFAEFWPTQPDDQTNARGFAEELIRGTVANQAALDERIKKYTEHWELSRIAAVDRNILRLAMYEMLFRDDIPPVVSINEAVDIAKKYSTRESGAFVNGILDRLRGDLPRPARTPAGN